MSLQVLNRLAARVKADARTKDHAHRFYNRRAPPPVHAVHAALLNVDTCEFGGPGIHTFHPQQENLFTIVCNVCPCPTDVNLITEGCSAFSIRRNCNTLEVRYRTDPDVQEIVVTLLDLRGISMNKVHRVPISSFRNLGVEAGRLQISSQWNSHSSVVLSPNGKYLASRHGGIVTAWKIQIDDLGKKCVRILSSMHNTDYFQISNHGDINSSIQEFCYLDAERDEVAGFSEYSLRFNALGSKYSPAVIVRIGSLWREFPLRGINRFNSSYSIRTVSRRLVVLYCGDDIRLLNITTGTFQHVSLPGRYIVGVVNSRFLVAQSSGEILSTYDVITQEIKSFPYVGNFVATSGPYMFLGSSKQSYISVYE